MQLEELAQVTRDLGDAPLAALKKEPHENVERMDKLERMMEQLTEDINGLRVQRYRVRTKGCCFICGKPGHWKRQCPQRRGVTRVSNKRVQPYFSFRIEDCVLGALSRSAVEAMVEVDGTMERCLIDTGAAVSLINHRRGEKLQSCCTIVRAVGGHSVGIDGIAEHTVGIGRRKRTHFFLVSPDAKQTILGADFLELNKAVIDLKRGKLLMECGSLPLINRGEMRSSQSVVAVLHLSPSLQSLINKYQPLFTDDSSQYGFCDWIEHTIPLTRQPYRPHGPRRIPIHLEAEVNRQVQEMLDAGVIEEAHSPYNSPVVLVKKTNGKYRFCVDFRRLNEISLTRFVPVPSVADIFDRLQQSRIFTVLDLRSGYWQLAIKQEDREKTAFTVGEKQYQFKRMPFGLSGAPFTFRRLMLRLLSELENVVVYGDDIVVYSQSEAEHIHHLAAVLERIQQSGLRINGPKSQIGKTCVTLLGHKVGQGELKPLPEKIMTIQGSPVPTSKRTLRTFLGRAGYYSKFVKDFNTLASPLYELLKQDRKFTWNAEAQRAFDQILQEMGRQELTLKLPIAGEVFTVATDASDVGIGAVLKQNHGTIEYACRTLTPAERRYSTIEKECLAIVWALDKWRPYLLGQRFHVETDHRPLEWIKSAKDPRGKLARWALRLQEYDFTIKHVPGRENQTADFLSRMIDDDDLPSVAFGINGILCEQDPERLATEQRSDKLLRKLITARLAGQTNFNKNQLKQLGPFAKDLGKLQVNEAGILMWIPGGSNPSVPVIPMKRRRNLVVSCHEMAHTGCSRTYDLLKQRAYWPGMKRDVEKCVLSCRQCQLMKTDCRGMQQQMMTIPVSEIGELWSVDVMGPFPLTRRGNQYILLMTEHFTRWIEATGIPDQRASTVTHAVMNHLVAAHGIPKAILTDQGPCFESEEFRNCLEKLGIKKLRTTPYHPQTNGLTERNNRTIKEWIAAKGGDWEEALPLLLLAHRATKQASTKKSPFHLMYGRQPRLPVDLEIGMWPTCRISPEETRNNRKTANRNLQATQARMMAKFQTSKGGRNIEFQIGSKVKYRDHQRYPTCGPGERKLLAKWKGPYEVVDRRGPVYTIARQGESRRVNAGELRKWYELEEETRSYSEHPRRSERLRRKAADASPLEGRSVVD
ncbi:unnamed protein product [Dicrocoelium dendriticum]|nr:unnamed protein product [Dicrocoelium dendriticum]